MKHLSEAQLRDLRDELKRQLAKLERSMTVTDEALKTVELDQAAVGRLSRMDSLQSQGMAKGLREREAVRLASIQEAMRRMDAGTFGVCTECGSEVGFQRLVVFPESATCAICAD
ncbi:MAG: TraR/DksA C4-type zinc finger protein [Acidobacteriota bacterium]